MNKSEAYSVLIKKGEYEPLFSILGQQNPPNISELVTAARMMPSVILETNGHLPGGIDTAVESAYRTLSSETLAAVGSGLITWDENYRKEARLLKSEIGDREAGLLSNAIYILMLSNNPEVIRNGVVRVLEYDCSSCNRNPAIGAFAGAAAIKDRDLMVQAAVKSTVAEWVPEIFDYAEFISKGFAGDKESLIEIARQIDTRNLQKLGRTGILDNGLYNVRGALTFLIAADAQAELEDYVEQHLNNYAHSMLSQFVMYFARVQRLSEEPSALVSTLAKKTAHYVLERHNQYENRGLMLHYYRDTAITMLQKLGGKKELQSTMDSFLGKRDYDTAAAIFATGLVELDGYHREKLNRSAEEMAAISTFIRKSFHLALQP